MVRLDVQQERSTSVLVWPIVRRSPFQPGGPWALQSRKRRRKAHHRVTSTSLQPSTLDTNTTGAPCSPADAPPRSRGLVRRSALLLLPPAAEAGPPSSMALLPLLLLPRAGGLLLTGLGAPATGSAPSFGTALGWAAAGLGLGAGAAEAGRGGKL
eukprot:1154233-Pelagomonas_calceolata.AAC.1